MRNFRLNLFGSFRATLAGEEITAFGTDKARALLAYLAIGSNQPHQRQYLAELFWPRQTKTKAINHLSQTVAGLRKALRDGPGENTVGESREIRPYLIVSRDTIQFNPDSDYELDVSSFAAILEAALTHYWATSDVRRVNPRLLRQALALYTGPLLDQFSTTDSAPFEEWLKLQREALNGRAIEGIELLMAYHERRGEYAQALEAGQRLIKLAPWEENAQRLVMSLLAMDGRLSEAQAHFNACRHYMTEELSVDPTPKTVQLFEEIQRSAVEKEPFSPDLPQAIHNLPNSLPLCMGREIELDDLAELIADPEYRLITLLGPGGIGKTRLALEAAREQIGLFPDGVFFVSLVESKTTTGLIFAIAEAIDFKMPVQGNPQDHLINYLKNKKMLLVLDHYPNQGKAVELVEALLRYPPDISILLTSPQRLNLHEEYPFAVIGLPYPLNKPITIDDTQNYGALSYLLDQVGKAKDDLVVDQDQISAAIRICELVEGMPLGLELASGAVGSGSLEDIANDIAVLLDFLVSKYPDAPPRYHSIKAAFLHSWKMLSDPEREAFQKLSIFRGGFTGQAAGEIAGVTPDLLRSLCAKSLLSMQDSSTDRYAMHDLLRKFASEKLERHASKCELARRHHANYFINYLKEINKELTGNNQRNALKTLSLEIDNVIQAWEWSVTSGLRENIAKGFEGLYHYSTLQARIQEGVGWFNQAIERWSGDGNDHELCGKLLARRGALLSQQGLISAARSSIEESLRILQRNGNKPDEIFALVNLANIAHIESNYEEAIKIARDSLSSSRRIQNPWGMAASLFVLGDVEYRLGRVDKAEMILLEDLSVAKRFGIPRYILSSLNTLGDIDCQIGRYGDAAQKFEECLALSREIDDRYSYALHLNKLGTVLHLNGNLTTASHYYQECLDHCRNIGDWSGQAIALSNLGEVAQRSGRYEDANSYYTRGLILGQRIQDDWTVMACLINLGELWCHLSQCHKAEKYLLEAIRIASQTNTLQMLTKALVSIGELYLQLGQIQRAMDCICYALRHPASEQLTRDRAQALMDDASVTIQDCHFHTLEEVLGRLMGAFNNRPDEGIHDKTQL